MADHVIETSIDIDASAEQVWAVLTDFERMPSWNPFITAISGELKPGSRLSVQIVPPGKKGGMRFTPTVLTVSPGRELRWLGRLFLPGLFDGGHYFLLEPMSDGRTRFIHGEHFSGLLVGALRGALAATETGFGMMNAALKEQAEKRELSSS